MGKAKGNGHSTAGVGNGHRKVGIAGAPLDRHPKVKNSLAIQGSFSEIMARSLGQLLLRNVLVLWVSEGQRSARSGELFARDEHCMLGKHSLCAQNS